MGLDWRTHVRGLVVVLVHCSASRSEPAGPAEQVLAVVAAAVVADAVEQAAFAEQASALPRQWV